MPHESDRPASVAEVLESVAKLSRAITTNRRVPFHGRDITRTQMQALFILAHGGRAITPGVIAADLGITPGAVTQLLDGLREKQVIETVVNPDDGRSRIIRLTEEAAEEVVRFERDTVERLLPLFDALAHDDLAQLADLLTRVTKER
ncbi:MarR family winged helix-turn-helix transcriptional regulator [Agromyces subbeticus]|uniref:MarR family winged helix-turn-helix transcriptional regulator n=1 Tax=Agromyces subbeticus TaxID=293890 RepID=UPI0003B46466|nr:MarR family transcriptional regulator [Agromyces subbeticus]